MRGLGTYGRKPNLFFVMVGADRPHVWGSVASTMSYQTNCIQAGSVRHDRRLSKATVQRWSKSRHWSDCTRLSVKPFRHLIYCLFAFGIAAGCASTTVTEREPRAGTETIARPETIYVYRFAATPADIPPWSAAADRYALPSNSQTADQLTVGRKLGDLVAKELVAEIRKMGLDASKASSETHPKVNDLMLTGYFESIESGSAARRVTLGFGSGAAEVTTVVEGYQMTSEGPRLLGSGKLKSGGRKTLGSVAPLAVFAATRSPIGLIIGGVANVTGEATGRNTVEGAAKRTAKEIADQLRVKFKKQGWVR